MVMVFTCFHPHIFTTGVVAIEMHKIMSAMFLVMIEVARLLVHFNYRIQIHYTYQRERE